MAVPDTQTNFKALGPPLNIVQFHLFLAHIFIYIIGIDWRGARVNYVTFIFSLYAKGHCDYGAASDV